MFYVLLFLTFAFIFKITRIKETVEFIKDRYGLILIAAVMIILIAFPVIALYYDFHNDSELFPSIRIFQKNGSNLVNLYTADIEENFFSESLTNNLKTSNNLWNLIGLIFEPIIQLVGDSSVLTSEIFMYVSLLPLLACVVAFKTRNKYVYLFWTIMVLTFFTMMNFKKEVLSAPTLFQEIISTIMPFLRKLEVLQNFGPLFLFCLVVIGAIGLNWLQRDNKNRMLWNISTSIVIAKNIFFVVSLYLFVKYKLSAFEWIYTKFQDLHVSLRLNINLRDLYSSLRRTISSPTLSEIAGYFPLFVILISCVAIVFLTYMLLRSTTKFKKIAIIVLLIDLAIFSLFHTTHFFISDIGRYERTLENHYSKALMQDNALSVKNDSSFENYRKPFLQSSLAEQHPNAFKTLWGYETYSSTKTAFPNIFKLLLYKKFAPDYDHFYMTKYYYDYLVNVTPYKQLATSGVIFPILNFYPERNAVFISNKYAVVEKINNLTISELNKYIFIEKNENEKLTSPDVSYFFDSKKYINYGEDELSKFVNHLDQKYLGYKNISYTIKDYNSNKVSLNINVPENGYFYFSDGYSKYWKAFVDDKETKIYKTNMNFKSVYVPMGKHKIDFIYDPVFFRYSLYAYFAGNLIAITVIILLYLNSRRETTVS